jgi:hypothetical protein
MLLNGLRHATLINECSGDNALIENQEMSVVRLGDYTSKWIAGAYG